MDSINNILDEYIPEKGISKIISKMTLDMNIFMFKEFIERYYFIKADEITITMVTKVLERKIYIPDDLLEYLIDNKKINWFELCINRKLSCDFIRKYQDLVCWFFISECQKLNEDFIEEFQDRVHWKNISKCQILSEHFIEKFQHKVDWKNISKYQKLSENFIYKFRNKVKWYNIYQHQEISQEFYDKSRIFLCGEDVKKFIDY